MTQRKPRIPSYRHHKARDCAVVTINGKNHYLGRWQSPESKELYDRMIGEWLANKRVQEKPSDCDARDEISVAEVIDAYWEHCKTYYGPESDRQRQTYNHKPILRLLNEVYGEELANGFGPLMLKAVRQQLIERGNNRTYCNMNTSRIKRMFKWAASEELVHLAVYQRLATLEGLKKGRSEALEPKKVPPRPHAACRGHSAPSERRGGRYGVAAAIVRLPAW